MLIGVVALTKPRISCHLPFIKKSCFDIRLQSTATGQGKKNSKNEVRYVIKCGRLWETRQNSSWHCVRYKLNKLMAHGQITISCYPFVSTCFWGWKHIWVIANFKSYMLTLVPTHRELMQNSQHMHFLFSSVYFLICACMLLHSYYSQILQRVVLAQMWQCINS